VLLFEDKRFDDVGVAGSRNHRAQIVDHEVEQLAIGTIDQVACATDDEAQIARMTFTVLFKNAAFIEEPLGLRANETDESGIGDFAIEPHMHANYR